MKTHIILIRHGQSLSNVDRIFTGNIDTPLTALGIRQAKATAEFLKGREIDAVYSSCLKRAYDTVKPIADARNIPVIKKEGLNECFFGDWGGLSYDDAREKYPEEYRLFKEEIGAFRAPNGESAADVRCRVEKALKEIVSENRGKTVAVATHGIAIKAILTVWKNLSLKEMQSEPVVTNGSVSEAVMGKDGAKIISVGLDEHLKDLKTPPPKL